MRREQSEYRRISHQQRQKYRAAHRSAALPELPEKQEHHRRADKQVAKQRELREHGVEESAGDTLVYCMEYIQVKLRYCVHNYLFVRQKNTAHFWAAQVCPSCSDIEHSTLSVR